MQLVNINNINFQYGTEKVLENVNWEINSGDYWGVIGPNGSGKTTLLKILLGLLKPQNGEVQLKINRNEIGYVPQKATQFDWSFPISVEEVVSLGGKNIDKALMATGVLELKKSKMRELSGGQQQRILIAKSLAGDPKLLILDEPTVGIDTKAQEDFYALLSKLNGDGLTLVMVSHDIETVVKEVGKLACVNKNVSCHMKPEDFMKDNYLEKLYGKSKRLVIHSHNHA